MSRAELALTDLLAEISRCRHCVDNLPLGPNPVVRASTSAKLLVVGQAPGTRVHKTGIPWNDPSGDRLRQWLGLTRDQFYDESKIAIVPMGFCYPGKGASGDLPPRPECAELWHGPLRQSMADVRLTLLIGQYAQRYYLPHSYGSLTQNVAHWRDFLPANLPLPHPSPRNNFWLRRNPWFDEVVDALQQQVKQLVLID